MANTLTLFASRKSIIHCLTTDTEVLKINNQQADAILGSRASYAHGLSPVKRLLGDLLWDIGPMNLTISKQKNWFDCNTDLVPKNTVARWDQKMVIFERTFTFWRQEDQNQHFELRSYLHIFEETIAVLCCFLENLTSSIHHV